MGNSELFQYPSSMICQRLLDAEANLELDGSHIFDQRPPLLNRSVSAEPSFVIHAFMGKPPIVTCIPNLSSDSSTSPMNFWLPKGASADATSLPEIERFTCGPPGICHLPVIAVLPSDLLKAPSGMRLPSFSPSLHTEVRRTSASAIVHKENS